MRPSYNERKPLFVAEYEWHITKELIKKMSEFSQSIDARFLVYQCTSVGSKSEKPTWLNKICNELNVSYLNSFEEFYEVSKGRKIFCFPHDGHWNVKGHEFVAERIYEYLAENRWI